MKISSSYMICLMSGILLVLVTSIKAEYEWNGTEWVWKDGPAVRINYSCVMVGYLIRTMIYM